MSEYENILLERSGRVGIITLNRPKALNALNFGLMQDVVAAATSLDEDERPEIALEHIAQVPERLPHLRPTVAIPMVT